MDANDLINDAIEALTPNPGFHQPDKQQLAEADVYARIATAQALNNIAAALAEIATNTAPSA